MITPLQHIAIDTTKINLDKIESAIANYYHTYTKATNGVTSNVRIRDPNLEKIDTFIDVQCLTKDEIEAFSNSKFLDEFILTCDISSLNYKKIIAEMLSTKESSKAMKYAFSLFDTNELSITELKQMLFKLSYKIDKLALPDA